MARIRIEWVPIKLFYLGVFGFDHLQLVYEPTGSTSQDDWFVMEGAKGKPYLEAIGADGTTTLAEANATANGDPQFGQDLVNLIGTPSTRGSRALPFLDPFSAWETMAIHAADMDGEFVYSVLGVPGTVIPSLNSSSLVASMLFYAGIDISNYIPFGMRRTSGSHTLLGTRSDDELTTDENFSTLASGQGNDTLQGTDANERFYGGSGDDVILWSKGYNLIHGGQYRMAYKDDGTDTVDYSGGGIILIQKSLFQADNAAPDYVVRVSAGAVDHLYSIERVQWSGASDTLQLEDVKVIEDGLLFKMGSQDSAQGDKIDLSGLSHGVLIDPTGSPGQSFIRAIDAADPAKGSWIESVETIVATAQADKIYIDDNTRVVDGGAGNDLIDARDATPFEGASPQGFDAELTGGAGNDTLVANAGHMLLMGGQGADKFIVSDVSSSANKVEVVIEDADASDRLYIPYALFNGSSGAFQGSELMPILGGIGQPGQQSSGMYSYFDWLLENQRWTGTDYSQGVIEFVGQIYFDYDGADLLVHLYKGQLESFSYPNGSGGTTTIEDVLPIPQTETTVRIKDFTEGDLGIRFYDPGTPVTQQLPDGSFVLHYPNYDSIVHTITADGARLAPLAAAPTGPAEPDPANAPQSVHISGTAGNDALVLANAQYRVDAGDGNDSISTGTSDDLIDGGTGADTMSAGTGNDTYIVDNAADSIIEQPGSGTDLVYSEVSYTLTAEVENLTLVGNAISGTGNGLANTLGGNELDNILTGGAGDDLLVGSAGNDTLIGGAGNDRYGYTSGDGADVVSDQGLGTDIDVVVINTGVTAADLTFVRPVATPQDLIVLLSDGGRITLKDFGVSAALSADEILLGDGTHYTRAQLTSIFNSAPSEGNATPVAQDDPWLGVNMSQVTFASALLLANDTDPDGDTLSIVSVGNAVSCVVTLDANGNIQLQTPVGSNTYASFTYTISDGHGGTSTAEVNVATATPGTTGVVDGTSGNDSLPGSDIAEVLHGNAGNDTLAGGGGADTLDGGAGTDWAAYTTATEGVTIYLDHSFANTGDAAGDSYVSIEGFIGSDYDDAILGTAAAEYMIGGFGADYFYGQGGDDTLDGGADMDGLTGGNGNDSLIGGGDIDSFYGNAGNDTLDGVTAESVSAVDEMVGGTGDDVYIVGGADNVYEAIGQGIDTVLARTSYTLTEGAEVEYLQADSPLVAFLAGNEFGQTLSNGNSGSAELIGGGGADTINGSNSGELIYGDFAGGTGPGVASADLIAANGGNDTIYGEAGYDVLLGLAGNDLIYGGDDNDSLDGGTGADTLNGDNGHDSLTGGDGNDLIYGNVGNDALYGQAGDDTLVGGWNQDTLVGGLGNDSLAGNDGNDRLDGVTEETTATRDTLDGGTGNDTYIVQGDDVIIEAAGNGTDVLWARSNYTLAQGVSIETVDADANGIIVTGNEFDQIVGYTAKVTTSSQLIGGGGNDTITSADWADTLYGDFAGATGPGAAGNDSISSNGGADTVYGEAGHDTIDGGTGSDYLYGGDGNDSLFGNDGNDTLYGGAGADIINGGNGADVLWGEAGNDQLTGGLATDRYMFRSGFGRDTITDRVTGELIDIQGFGATYANLVFTLTASGMEISSPKFGAGNVIVLANATLAPDATQFVF